MRWTWTLLLLAAGCAPEARWRRDLAAGRAAAREGRALEAEARLAKALRAADSFEPDDPRRIESLQALAALRAEQRALESAEALYAEAARLAESRSGTADPGTLRALRLLGETQTARERYREAGETYRRALRAAEEAYGPDDPELIEPLSALARIAQELGRNAEALAPLSRALSIAERSRGPEHPETVVRLAELVRAHRLLGSFEKGTTALDKMLEALGRDALAPAVTVNALHEAALFEEARTRLEAAEGHYRRALALVKASKMGDALSQRLLEGYAHLLRRRGRHDEAESIDLLAVALREAPRGRR